MRTIEWKDFGEAVGSVYSVSTSESDQPLSLVDAELIDGPGRDGGSFRLEFLGPAHPVLSQDIYPFVNSGDVWEIFIVPISNGAEGTRYEAIFN